jgi:hypothetical protein
MTNLKKIGILLSILFIIFLVSIFFTPQAVINSQKKKIEAEVHETCASCQLKIGEIHYSLLRPGQIKIAKLSYVTGTGEPLETKFMASQIQIYFDPKKLFDRFLQIRLIEMNSAEVELMDVDHLPPHTHADSKEENDFHFMIQKIHISAAQIKYTRKHHGTSATIQVHHIEGEIGDITDLKRPASQLSTAHFHLNIEKTGHIELNIDTPDFLKIKDAMVSLAVSNQDLSELNVFLQPNAGVILKGHLIKGLGFINMHGQHLDAKLHAVYQNLLVKVEPSVQRSELESDFTNIGASLLMNPDNLMLAPKEQSRNIQTDRKEKESVVAFMLRGLKEAAIQVSMVSQKNNQKK